MRTIRFFNKRITPSCEYCKYSRIAAFDKTVLCEKTGILKEFSSCRNFVYDPVKRKPAVPYKKPRFDFDAESFML